MHILYMYISTNIYLYFIKIKLKNILQEKSEILWYEIIIEKQKFEKVKYFNF